MTISQSGSSLKGDTAELGEVAVDGVAVHRSSLEILHQFIVAVFAIYIGLAKVIETDDHLKLHVEDNLHQVLLDVYIGIIDLQHIFLSITLHQIDLCLA